MKFPFRFFGTMLVLATEVTLARGQLVSLSPFLPPGGAAAGAADQSGPIELRGVMATPEGARFCIYDTVKKSSAWVGLNESGRDFVVKSYDLASDSVTVTANGQTERIRLRIPRISSNGSVMFLPESRRDNPIIQTVVVNPTAADEAKRLEAVAAEVQRRRLMREQAMQGTSPGSAPAPGMPGVDQGPPRMRRP